MSERLWKRINESWKKIDIYDGPNAFLETFATVPRAWGILFAANFCQYEICNGGFHQFFFNSTGVLAHEAVEGFHAIEMHTTANLIETAMRLLGDPYPRERLERQARLGKMDKQILEPLNDEFFKLIGQENGGFQKATYDFGERISIK